MKNLMPLLFLMLAVGSYSSALAQDKYACSLKAELEAPLMRAHLKSAFADVLSRVDTRFELHQFLMKDKTDEQPYVTSVLDEKSWFVCNHFSNQLFLRASALVNADDYTVLEEKTPIRFSEARSANPHRLPLFTLNITNYSTQYYHALNALYLGDAKGDLSDLSSYLFIEPQNDGIFLSVDQMIRHYFGPNNLDKIELSVTLPAPVGFSPQGEVQYHSNPVATFDCANNPVPVALTDQSPIANPSTIPLKAPSLVNADLNTGPREESSAKKSKLKSPDGMNSLRFVPQATVLSEEDEAQLVIPDAVEELNSVPSALLIPEVAPLQPKLELKEQPKEGASSKVNTSEALPSAESPKARPSDVQSAEGEDSQPVRKFIKKLFRFGRE